MSVYQQSNSIFAAISAGYSMPYENVEMTERWISDGLKHELETWDYSKPGLLGPVLINAPTGSGKSTFIMTDLAQRVKSFGKYVLLLSNRSVLELQQKYFLSQQPGEIAWSGATLPGLHLIGNVLVFTYQSVLEFLEGVQQMSPYPIGAVVLDEAHFFCSDATFNADTERILNSILTHCWNCQRIYMSATPDDVRWLIAYEEQRYRVALNNSRDTVQMITIRRNPISSIKEYRFPVDYSNIKLSFWCEWEDVLQTIKADDTDDKWLVFVRDTETGRRLKKDLGSTAAFMDAANKERSPQRASDLARREYFETKVLIATSVLDNGVNFKDSRLKHIVIDSVDPVQIKQMLGRKRVQANETVKLHILRKTQKEVDAIRQNLYEQYQFVQELYRDPYYAVSRRWESLSEAQRSLVKPFPNGFHTSGYAAFQLDRMIARVDELNDRMVRCGDDAFVQVVCEWFGPTLTGEVTAGENRFDRAKKAVQAVFEKYTVLSPLNEETVVSLELELKESIKALGSEGPKLRKGDSRTNANINETARFFELPLSCKKENKQWILQNGSAAQDDISTQ